MTEDEHEWIEAQAAAHYRTKGDEIRYILNLYRREMEQDQPPVARDAA